MITKKHTFLILTILYLSLLTGFYFNEDLLGGAYDDYRGLYYVSENFKNNFVNTFLNYDELGHRQSPIFYILRSFFGDIEIIQRLIFLHIFLLIPIYFYKSLKIKYKNIDKNHLKLIASLILIFPTFRSYSIWPDPHLFGILFFIVSIYFFLKFKNEKNILENAIFCSISLALSAYMSPNFGIFIIYFFYEFLIKFNISKKIIKIALLNILLSLPFFIYLFYFKVNFIFNKIGWDIGDNFYSIENISNKILIISSIFFFYLFPLLNYKVIKQNLILKKIYNFKFILLIILFLFTCYLFDFTSAYNLTNSGGGFFYNISNFIFNNNFLFYLICFLAILFIGKACFDNQKNTLLFFCLILSNPQVTIWQANFSPTLFFLILLLFSLNLINKNFNVKRVFFIYLYFISYVVINFAKNILI
jgi:hypothetical protein